jgi:hypothetical protein
MPIIPDDKLLKVRWINFLARAPINSVRQRQAGIAGGGSQPTYLETAAISN